MTTEHYVYKESEIVSIQIFYILLGSEHLNHGLEILWMFEQFLFIINFNLSIYNGLWTTCNIL